MKKPLIVGLTGGLASGKSTVLNLFRQLGAATLSADHVVHDLIAFDGEAYFDIVKHFSDKILNEQHDIDRAKLRAIIFQQPNEKHWLEQYLHPLVRKSLFEQAMQTKSAYIIIEIPLLTESIIQYSWLNRILVIETDEETQLDRAFLRSGFEKHHSRSIIDQQASREARRQIADDIIVNQGDLSALELEVKRLHNKYQTLAIRLENCAQ